MGRFPNAESGNMGKREINLIFIGAPGRIRTYDIQIRSLALYPAEPRARNQ